MGLFGILLGLVLLVCLAYRGWSILLLAPGAALIAAAFAGGPILAYWTQTFMDSGSRFVSQFFPLFLLGALFGKLMEDSGSVAAIADFMTKQLGPQRAILTVVLAGALVTYGGVSPFVAFFVRARMAQALFRTAAMPNRLMPATIALGTSTFTMSALPGTPAIQNAIPMPFFGTTPLAAPGLGIIASAIMLAFGLWWLERAENAARRRGEGFGLAPPVPVDEAAEDETVRQRATSAREFDPPEVHHGRPSREAPPIVLAALPLLVVVSVNVLMSLVMTSQSPPRRLPGIARPCTVQIPSESWVAGAVVAGSTTRTGKAAASDAHIVRSRKHGDPRSTVRSFRSKTRLPNLKSPPHLEAATGDPLSQGAP